MNTCRSGCIPAAFHPFDLQTFPQNPNSPIQKSCCSKPFTNFSGGSLSVVFCWSALTPRAQKPKKRSLLQTKRRRCFTPASSNIAVYGWGVVVESPESAHLPPNRWHHLRFSSSKSFKLWPRSPLATRASCSPACCSPGCSRRRVCQRGEP